MSQAPQQADPSVTGEAHWTNKGDIKLFLWEKYQGTPGSSICSSSSSSWRTRRSSSR
ncbi:MAG: hypothetical protein QF654_04835 [Alphaproteobacteria bacterium]|jgi:hypothetical protein|nr:hypothetical protein [Alphaproteobacteria bacterium]|tara:strand:+ start:119 stop:289 length:171 start_codon:yes stop_codon:yes gene_type:complete